MIYKSVKFTFNTHRPYTQLGQIIHVEYDPNTNTTYFHDESRMVAGKFPNSYADISERRLQELVMMAYDNGLYHYAPIPPSGKARRPTLEEEERLETRMDRQAHDFGERFE